MFVPLRNHDWELKREGTSAVAKCTRKKTAARFISKRTAVLRCKLCRETDFSGLQGRNYFSEHKE
jgi:hypothetical protein